MEVLEVGISGVDIILRTSSWKVKLVDVNLPEGQTHQTPQC